MSNQNLKVKLLSSLEKVFADEFPSAEAWSQGSMLKNEVYSFQVAYFWDGLIEKDIKIQQCSTLSSAISIKQVGLIPSEMPCYWNHDDFVLRTAPGLYPDILLPAEAAGITLLPCQWRALWVTIDLRKETAAAGTYPIEITFVSADGNELGKAIFEITILEALLPAQKLIHTEWFHTDCISTYYGLEVFSDEYWQRVEQFIENAVQHGINMILTPIFTPPLDTAIGGERPTVQLVDVCKQGDTYTFGFQKLKKWVQICRKLGVEYFEFSHLFTQWGAKHAPKIMAEVDGKSKQIFGWDTDAAGEEYKLFLNKFLPELLKFIEENELKNRSYFHVSDEPQMKDLSQYKLASSILDDHLKDYPVIDALSDYEFYKTGAVRHPIPSNDHIGAFLDFKVPELWTYYCCVQHIKVSNRFFNMPSMRNRILGLQLYKFNIKGFLHWAYNFWYSQYSLSPIDPYRVSDAAYGFPSGDSYLVYPGESGPLDSLRFEVLYEALQDLRALELLESLIGKPGVLEMLEKGLKSPIAFDEYPHDAEWLLSKREEINRMIASLSTPGELL